MPEDACYALQAEGFGLKGKPGLTAAGCRNCRNE